MMNLENYLKENGHTKQFIDLMKIVVKQVPQIKAEFQRGDEKTGVYNIYGEEQAKMDQRANEIWIEALSKSKLVKEIATEEEKDIIRLNYEKGYGVTIDPLDGSSLLPTNLAVGSIFSIYENGEIMSGLQQISAAFYILFGPLTLMVFADKKEVSQFIFNERKKQFDLVKRNLTIPEGKLYAPGGLRKDWLENHKKAIEYLEKEGFKLRYSGSFVADFHQILIYGGIFTYPALLNEPNGKLRLLFEVGPMAFIAEKAKGEAIDGKNRILDIIPAKVDQRIPIYIGSKKVIEEIKSILAQ
jgi:fructose-1,6-bisphosphatase I